MYIIFVVLAVAFSSAAMVRAARRDRFPWLLYAACALCWAGAALVSVEGLL